MQRKVILSVLVLVLLLASLATALVVMAAKKDAPPRMVIHDAGCLAYCARAIMYEDFDGDGIWAEWDLDGDGKVEICPLEGENCHKMAAGVCPEVASTDGGPLDHCQLLSDFPEPTAIGADGKHVRDDMRFACELQHGEDTHNVTH